MQYKHLKPHHNVIILSLRHLKQLRFKVAFIDLPTALSNPQILKNMELLNHDQFDELESHLNAQQGLPIAKFYKRQQNVLKIKRFHKDAVTKEWELAAAPYLGKSSKDTISECQEA